MTPSATPDGATTPAADTPAWPRAALLGYALVGHLAATSSFAYLLGFLLDRGVPRTVARGGPLAPPLVAALVDLALVACFAVPHSVLARRAWKARRRRAVPAAVERSTYNLVASATLALLFWRWHPIPTVVWRTEGAAAVLLAAGFWAGWALCAASVLATNLFELTGLRQGWRAARAREGVTVAGDPLTRRFAYGYARHPLYVGFFLVLWSVPAMDAGRLLLAAACTGYVLLAVPYEERDLAAVHGEAYARYRREVPRFGIAWPGHGQARRDPR